MFFFHSFITFSTCLQFDMLGVGVSVGELVGAGTWTTSVLAASNEQSVGTVKKSVEMAPSGSRVCCR